MATLASAPIPQYAKQGQAFSYTLPAYVAEGGGVITAIPWVNRPNYGLLLPSWCSFNSGTRQFSGTPTIWEEVETLQIIIELQEVGQSTRYYYMTLRVGPSDLTGRPVPRNGQSFNHTLNAANLATFDTATVSSGQWVKIDSDLYPLNATAQTKIAECRTNGGWLVWKVNNSNRTLLFTGSVVPTAMETVDTDFSLGNIGAIQPNGLAIAPRGQEIHFTNLGVKGFIQDNTTQPVLHKRVGSNVDANLVWFGQPSVAADGQVVPYVDVFGIGLKSTSSTLLRATSGFVEGLEFAFIELGPGTAIGYHIKSDLTATQGDRRAAQNSSSIDYNMKYITRHHCYIHDTEGEGVYDGGGFWAGRNGDGNRFYHWIEYCRTWHCICFDCGWDAIQVKNVIRGGSVKYNHVYRTGVLPGASNAQRFGIFFEAAVIEVAYNWIELAGRTGLRAYDFGLSLVHNNLIIKPGSEGIYGAKLPVQNEAPNQNPGPLRIDIDIPTALGYSPGSDPRSDLTTDSQLYCFFFHNTIVEAADTLKLFSDTPGTRIRVQNNLIVNSGRTTIDVPAGTTQTGNQIVTGATLTDIFVDPANKDYRIKVGSIADATGVDISAVFSVTKDYGNKTRNTATPGVGAFESGSTAWQERYNYVLNPPGSGNLLPTCSVGADVVVTLPTTQVVCTSTASDPDGTIASRQWSQIIGPNTATLAGDTTATLTASNLVQGVYIFRLTVTDNAGGTAFDELQVTVQEANETYHKFYISDDVNGANEALYLATTDGKWLPPAGLNKWWRRGTIGIASTGTVASAEFFTTPRVNIA